MRGRSIRSAERADLAVLCGEVTLAQMHDAHVTVSSAGSLAVSRALVQRSHMGEGQAEKQRRSIQARPGQVAGPLQR